MTIPSNTPFPSLPARLSWAAPGELARRLPISELAQAPVSKRGLVRSYWYVNDFFIPMQIKLVFQQQRFWKWEFLDLENGLLKKPVCLPAAIWFSVYWKFKFATFLENYFKNSLRQCYKVKLQIQILRDKQGPIVKSLSVITLMNSLPIRSMKVRNNSFVFRCIQGKDFWRVALNFWFNIRKFGSLWKNQQRIAKMKRQSR